MVKMLESRIENAVVPAIERIIEDVIGKLGPSLNRIERFFESIVISRRGTALRLKFQSQLTPANAPVIKNWKQVLGVWAMLRRILVGAQHLRVNTIEQEPLILAMTAECKAHQVT